MAPKKSTQQKRGQKRARATKEAEASTSSQQIRAPAGLNAEEKIKYRNAVIKKKIKPHSILDWDRLDEYGLVPAMRRLLSDPAWLRMFSYEERAYKETTLAFLASFSTKNQIRPARMVNEVTFYAFGQYRTVSMKKFVRAMGLYSKEELDDPEFEHLWASLPYGVNSTSVWRTLTGTDDFEASKSKSLAFRMTSHRVFHYLQVRNLNAKMESPGMVRERDIIPLYSVVQPYRVNVGILVADAIRHQASDRNNGVYIGGMITRILKNLKLWPKTGGPTDIGPKPTPLPKDPFSQWNTPKINVKNYDIEAPGSELPPPDIANFSAGNLVRLQRTMTEIKRNQEEMMRKQNGIIELLKAMARRFGDAIPSCLCTSPPREEGDTREEGESSQGPQPLLPPPAPVFPPLDTKALARGVILSSSDEEDEEEEDDDSEELGDAGSNNEERGSEQAAGSEYESEDEEQGSN